MANSDFDLRYSGGTVQALDLAALRETVDRIPQALADGASVAEACAQAGLGANPDPWLNPGPCSPLPVAPRVRSHAFIGAFASGLLLTHDPNDARARLFVPVRGDPSITYFDIQDDRAATADFAPSFRLDCAQLGDGFCHSAHRIGRDPDRNLRGVQLPADPVGIAGSADGSAIVTAHQTQKAASLLYNDWTGTPWLSYFANNLPQGPTELVPIPPPALVAAAMAEAEQEGRSFDYHEGFVLTFRSTAQLDILRYYPDSGAAPPRPFIVRGYATAVTITASGYDSRGVAVLDDERRACEATCDELDVDCLEACAAVPLQLFVANRSPASLLIGEVVTELDTAIEPGDPAGSTVLTGASESLYLYDSVPLTFGPSRLEVGTVINADGELEQRVFAVCFDSRTVFAFDPAEHRLELVIRAGRGPHDIAFDSGQDATGRRYAHMYVGHFTDSYLGVVDLDMRRPLTYGQMFASVGVPSEPVEAK